MLTQVPWTAAVDAALVGEAGRVCVPLLKLEVAAGRSRLWRFDDGADRAYMVTRVDKNPTELVVCYLEGRGVAKFAQLVLDAARVGRMPIRVHTTNPAIVRWLRRFGFRMSEYVVRA